ncbi:MAG: PDZ domain-containing protein [Sphingomonadales bacterium]|nr:PDZ domain-containing protein [Sphingomonadales bacterium]
MKFKIKWFAIAAYSMAPAAALADKPFAMTPSGATEAIFDMPVTNASDALVNGCVDAGQTVISSTSTVVVCEFYLNTTESVLGALLLGNQYSTPPRSYVRFNAAELRGSTRVTANAWLETQMAFGQIRKQDLGSDHFHNEVMGFLASAGGRFPPGTEFPNHAYIGLRWEAAVSPEKGLRVIEVAEGSPADEAGVQLGDVVTAIARERIKDISDVLDGLHKAARSATYEVALYRDGKKMNLELPRRFRQTEPAPNLPAVPDLAEQPEVATQVTQVISPVSIADELAKFAKLRSDGIITDDEFEQQKAKLLGQDGNRPD